MGRARGQEGGRGRGGYREGQREGEVDVGKQACAYLYACLRAQSHVLNNIPSLESTKIRSDRRSPLSDIVVVRFSFTVFSVR